jgi:hypothetical protein
VRPPAPVQPLVLGAAAELPGGFDHAAVVGGEIQVRHEVDVVDRSVGALGRTGALRGVLGEVAGQGGAGELAGLVLELRDPGRPDRAAGPPGSPDSP